MNALYQDLLNQNINNVKIIAIGKGQYSSDNSNWTDGNSIPVLVDPSPYDVWDSWGANQRDLFFLDANGDYVTHFNITSWDYDNIYDTIMSLLKPDLIVSSLSPDPDTIVFQVDEAVDWEAIIQNIGSTPSSGGKVGYYLWKLRIVHIWQKFFVKRYYLPKENLNNISAKEQEV